MTVTHATNQTLATTEKPERPAPRILVVEDEPKSRAAVAEALELEGFVVAQASREHEMQLRMAEQDFDLLILDWMLPGRDGIELLRHLRARGAEIPILMLTACTRLSDRVLGFTCGADDYLMKPFAISELTARCRTLLRRPLLLGSEFLGCAGLRLDVRNRIARRDGTQIPLTVRETQVLEYLLRHQGQAISRDSLAREIWREERRSASLDNVIDAQILRLRKKIDVGPVKLLHTLRGIGYRFGDEQPPHPVTGE